MDLIEAFRALPWFFVATVLVVGTMIGSFLNVVIHRLPKIMENDWRQQCIEFRGQKQPRKRRLLQRPIRRHATVWRFRVLPARLAATRSPRWKMSRS